MFFIKNIIIFLCLSAMLFTGMKDKNIEKVIIPSDSIRFRIISNSDSSIDINEKMILKSIMEKIIFDLIKDVKSSKEVDEIIVNNFEFINENISKYLGHNNYKLDYGKNYFPKKIYNGVVYNEGYYDSLVITLGNGKGKNWWCVLFPPLCLLDENKTTNDVEYQFFVSRIINKFK